MNGRFSRVAITTLLPFVIAGCSTEPERGIDGKPITGYSGLRTCEDFLEKASSLAEDYNNYEYQNYGQETVLEDGTVVSMDGNKIVRDSILIQWARTVLRSQEGCFPSDQVKEASEVKESNPHLPW